VTQATHDYPDGNATYTIQAVGSYAVSAGDREGFGPGFWKQPQHFHYWTGYHPTDDFESVFGVSNPDKPPTLLDALQTGGGGLQNLWRHAVAALLNAANPNINYEF